MVETSRSAPKICCLTETFYPPNVDGMAIHAYQLVERLTSKGLEVFVITRQTESPSADSECIGNILVRRIPPRGQLRGKGWEALGPMLLFIVRMLYLLMRSLHRYDLIVVSGLKILPIPAVLASMIGRKKCIIRVDSPIELWEEITIESLRRMGLSRTSILLKLWRSIRSAVIRRADCVVAISSEICRELDCIGMDPHKTRFIPYGIDTNKFRPVSSNRKRDMRLRLSLPRDKIILTFTGRLAASKGVPLLMQVWQALIQRYKDIHLVLVGSGEGSHDSCERELRDYIEAHELEQSVLLTGEVDNVVEYLQASDVFVFPSEYEGFGMSIVEALACALPTVSTTVGVASDHIRNRENGVLVRPKNQQELQTAIEWLLDHKDLWATIGLNARRSVVAKYSLDAEVEKYLELFIELQSSDRGQLSRCSEDHIG